ncbi:hypothetical protein Peur_053191 [Populus x canadensis]
MTKNKKIILQKKHLEEVSMIRSIISYLAVILSRYQLKLKVLANKPIIWPLMVLEVFLKFNALRWSLLQKATPSSTSLVQLFFQTSTLLKFLQLPCSRW